MSTVKTDDPDALHELARNPPHPDDDRAFLQQQLELAPAEPQPDAPTDIAELPDYWDARRRQQGKPDLSRCAAELRIALAGRTTEKPKRVVMGRGEAVGLSAERKVVHTRDLLAEVHDPMFYQEGDGRWVAQLLSDTCGVMRLYVHESAVPWEVRVDADPALAAAIAGDKVKRDYMGDD